MKTPDPCDNSQEVITDLEMLLEQVKPAAVLAIFFIGSNFWQAFTTHVSSNQRKPQRVRTRFTAKSPLIEQYQI
jgi:hypothetical protein